MVKWYALVLRMNSLVPSVPYCRCKKTTRPAVVCTIALDVYSVPVESAEYVPPGSGQTCGTMAAYAKSSVEPGSSMCTDLQYLELSCCGGGLTAAPNNTNRTACSFCPKGISNADFVVPGANDTTCEDLAFYANYGELVPSECEGIQMAESVCCRSKYK